MKRQLEPAAYKMLVESIEKMGLAEYFKDMRLETTQINGATLVSESNGAEGRRIRYVEDEVRDEKGNLYLFESPSYEYLGEFRKGKRMIAIYHERGYDLLPVDGTTYVLVGATDVTLAKRIDLGKSKLVSNPLLLEAPREAAREVTEEDRKQIQESFVRYGNTGKSKGARIFLAVALCILCLIVYFLLYVFGFIWLYQIGIMTFLTFIPYTLVVLALLVVSCVFSVRGGMNIYLRRVLKKRYIKPVMFLKRMDTPLPSVNASGSIVICEWRDGEPKISGCSAGVANCFLPKDLRYGEIIYMLTKKPEVAYKRMADIAFFYREKV